MARFRQFTKRQLWQRFLVQKVPTFYMIVDKLNLTAKFMCMILANIS
jgi:hypothetical protein